MKELYSISKRLKALRDVAGVTQEEFAEYAEMSHKFYQQVESGKKKLVRLDTVQRLAEAYGLELWEFFRPEIPKISIKLKKRINSSPHNTRKKDSA